VVALRRYTDADFALTEALETDPDAMRELGGPRAVAELAEAHRRRVLDPWWTTIVIDDGVAVGTIGIWPKEYGGRSIHETGWMVLPAFHGRGIASAALGLLIKRVRSAPQVDGMHAFPPISNAPSNALCRKFGFTLLEAADFNYAGRPLRCNHWELRTDSGPPP